MWGFLCVQIDGTRLSLSGVAYRSHSDKISQSLPTAPDHQSDCPESHELLNSTLSSIFASHTALELDFPLVISSHFRTPFLDESAESNVIP